MRKVKESMSRTSKSMLVLVGSTMESVEFWRQMVTTLCARNACSLGMES